MSYIQMIGLWLGILQLPEANLPFHFNFEVRNGKPVMVIQNADERILCDEIIPSGDSVFIRMPLYDSELRMVCRQDTMRGTWINRGRKTPAEIPFMAIRNVGSRFQFEKATNTHMDISHLWETWFESGTPDSSLAIGQFKVNEKGIVYGTFLTESGDHRFLEGCINGDSLKMSVFDGSHAWLYLAKTDGKYMNGMFYSGNHYKAAFRAVVNDSIKLRDPLSITSVEGPVNVKLPDTDNRMISSSDSLYKHKVIIYQIMGTWCPNCMDESVFLDSIYKARKEEGLEIIGLAFERTEDFNKAAPLIKRTVSRLNISYPVLVAGMADKKNVQKVIPGIRDFFSYPTTIVSNRDGNVVKVHTGFSGPATGQAWDNYKNDFSRTLDRLLR